MIKLCRNAFGSLRSFKSPDGVIRYEFVEKLVEYQQSIGLNLANKVMIIKIFTCTGFHTINSEPIVRFVLVYSLSAPTSTGEMQR